MLARRNGWKVAAGHCAARAPARVAVREALAVARLGGIGQRVEPQARQPDEHHRDQHGEQRHLDVAEELERADQLALELGRLARQQVVFAQCSLELLLDGEDVPLQSTDELEVADVVIRAPGAAGRGVQSMDWLGSV